jgi:protoheme IX farnesyltransferase
MRKGIIRDYYQLAKPGIIYGNLLTTVAAFFFATRWLFFFFGPHIIPLFFGTVVGISLVIGSACVFNNFLDKDIDADMSRTKDRALVTGMISNRNAIIYAYILGIIGFGVLLLFVNILTTAIAFFGFFMYVVVYTYAKRKTYWGALIGTIPGAVPIVVGYTAVTNRFDLTAFVLFFILIFWQMPHFYAIAIRRLDEYNAAGIPVFPAKKGVETTKWHILLFIIMYVTATVLLAITASLGYTYLILVLFFGAAWLVLAVKGFKTLDNEKWAKRLFLFSLIILLMFSLLIAVAPLLP